MTDDTPKVGRPRKPKLAPILLHYDYWVNEGRREKAGQVIELPTDEAKRLIAEGKAERADPFPGEAG